MSEMQNQGKGAPGLGDLRVWLVHDWLTGMRGGEKVLFELVKMFPRARIATLVHVKGSVEAEIERRVERVSFLQRMPGVNGKDGGGFRNYLPLFPRAVRSLKLDGECDLAISVSHAVAKGVRVPVGRDGKQVPHVCYCNTPMRYIWGMEDHYLSAWSWKRAALAAVKPYLRAFDRRNAGVTAFLGNSANVAERIRRIYGREAAVVYPGIDEAFYTLDGGTKREDFYLMVGALVGYKRVDVAVEAFGAMGKRLVVIGAGPEEERLKKMAAGKANITFLGRQSDEVVREHYRRCRGFVFPGEEDFGLTPVEAQACGAPVVAYGRGGALETVREGKTGVFFGEQTATGICGAVERLEADRFLEEDCRANALRFTWEGFRKGIRAVVRQVMTGEIRMTNDE